MRLCPAILLALALVGCGTGTDDDDTAAGPVWLVDHDDWAELGADDDPFDDRLDDIECLETAWGYEFIGEDAFEVRTNTCDYITVAQPSLAAGRVGDEMHLRLWHHQLTNFEEAEAHAAVSIGGELVWEVRHGIPGDSGMDSPYWDSETDFEAGDEVLFHLHNHGSNTWNFIELSVLPK
ncbi:MAG: hypothetical protein GY898_31750 [Proteobacteria bacterium]|nr:hypothetical protein [Pseudomonadota bacterium]